MGVKRNNRNLIYIDTPTEGLYYGIIQFFTNHTAIENRFDGDWDILETGNYSRQKNIY